MSDMFTAVIRTSSKIVNNSSTDSSEDDEFSEIGLPLAMQDK
jgi:hypothetical protein